jgi:hypothetical protein
MFVVAFAHLIWPPFQHSRQHTVLPKSLLLVAWVGERGLWVQRYILFPLNTWRTRLPKSWLRKKPPKHEKNIADTAIVTMQVTLRTGCFFVNGGVGDFHHLRDARIVRHANVVSLRQVRW